MVEFTGAIADFVFTKHDNLLKQISVWFVATKGMILL